MKTKNPFVNIYLHVKRRWLRCESLSEQIFWAAAILTDIALALELVISFIEGIGTGFSNILFIIAIFVAALINSANMVIGYKTKKYQACYSVYCIAISVVILPACFITRGGFESGSPVYCLLPLLLSSVHENKKWRAVINTVVLSVTAILFSIAWVYPEAIIHPDGVDFRLDMTVTVVISAFAIIVSLGMVLSAYKRKEELRIRDMKKRDEFRIENLEAQIENIEDVKRMRHDMRHHNAVIAQYAENGDLEGLIEYLKLKNASDEYNAKKIFCMNTVLNNVLCVYYRNAKREGIVMDIDAEMGENDIPFSAPDVVALFANVIENAIHGAKASENEYKYVKVNIRKKAGKMVFKCTNSCNENVQVKHGAMKNPGTGISSIMKFLKAHGGTLEYEKEDAVITCTVIVDLQE